MKRQSRTKHIVNQGANKTKEINKRKEIEQKVKKNELGVAWCKVNWGGHFDLSVGSRKYVTLSKVLRACPREFGTVTKTVMSPKVTFILKVRANRSDYQVF